MILGIFSKIFVRPTLCETLEAVRQLGIRHVQFNPANAIPGSAEEFARRGIGVSVLSATYNIIHPDLAERQRGLDRFKLLAQAAGKLGAKILSVSTGTRDPEDMWRKHADNDTPESWREMLSATSALAAIAEEYGVVAAFEPEQANIVDSAQKARVLLDTLRSKNLKVLVDAANLLTLENLSQQDRVLTEAFNLLGEDIVAAHAKEFSRSGQLGNSALGEGALNFPLYVSLLKNISFENALIMHGFSESEAVASTRYLNEILMRE